VFCVDLRTNSDYFSIQHSVICFYKQGRECLLRGTDWVFKSEGYSFVLKWLSVCHIRLISCLVHLDIGHKETVRAIFVVSVYVNCDSNVCVEIKIACSFLKILVFSVIYCY